MARNMVQVRRKGGHNFSEVPSVKIPRSQFNRSHGLKTTFDSDLLVPVMVDEVLPGDTWTCRMSGFARLFSPLKTPIMDNIYIDVHFFFVPTRLLWANWEKFNGAQDNPGDSTDFVIPKLRNGAVTSVEEGSLHDYMGLPLGLDFDETRVSALPFRGLDKIYNDWYRDQNLIDSTFSNPPRNDGPDDASWYSLHKRAKRKDYFTAALPWPQKSENPVSVPLGDYASIVGLGVATAHSESAGPLNVQEGGVGGQATTYQSYFNAGTEGSPGIVIDSAGGLPDVYVDLQSASSIPINSLREAFQIQRLLERDARGGTRYIEVLKSHFGVTSPDYRLQRAEYLGGGKAMVNVSPVAQTGPTQDGAGPATTPQGNLTAVGTSALGGMGFAKSFVEHGYVYGIASARADLTYQQGLSRMWSRETRYDFYWPSLAQLGEQPIMRKELLVTNSALDDEVFGYQERYAEYRFAASRITGKFRSDAAGSLDIWHLAEDFASTPLLNQAFIEYNTPMQRVMAVENEPDFILDAWFDLKCARPMPLYGVPGMVDHF